MMGEEIMIRNSALFRHSLPQSRLGTSHSSLKSYNEAVERMGGRNESNVPSEFSLVVLLTQQQHLEENSSNISILLGKKLRGFGKGFYNCFGGKLERDLDEHNYPYRGAVREVHEETGINVPLEVMEDGYVGTLNFSFDDWEVNKAMKVYLYCVVISLSPQKADDENHNRTNPDGSRILIVDPDDIRGCDEINPVWFNDVYDIPLHQMFADDSLWLVMLLSHYDHVFKRGTSFSADQNLTRTKLMFDSWFHFQSGGADTNTIQHHYIKMGETSSPDTKFTLEKQLFHALHLNQIHSPSIKEFKENWAMANAVRRFINDKERIEYVIDVAGGHGALGALFLILAKKCHTATVIDPAVVKGKDGIQKVWSSLWNSSTNNDDRSRHKQLKYRHECLRTGLRDELDKILNGMDTTKPTKILVVACHACQHLTDETMQIASEYGVNVACMPCCQKDHDGWWKISAKQMGVSIGAMMDLLSAGKMMAWETGAKRGVRYQVKMKLIDEKISPLQNRIILCKAMDRDDDCEDAKTELAHAKLTKAYNRAHKQTGQSHKKQEYRGENQIAAHDLSGAVASVALKTHVASLVTGFCIGILVSLAITNKSRRS